MSNLHLSVEQVSRKQQQIETQTLEVGDKTYEESNLDTSVYSTGYFEGYIGLEPKQPGNHSYWSGYQLGQREYWAKKLGVEIPTEF